MDHKKRIQNAVEKWSQRQLPMATYKKKNKKPEADFMLELKKYLNETLNYSVDIVESKGVFNEEAGRYMHGKTRPGFPDICGNTQDGQAVWIEVKAPGKRSTLRPDQREFLIEKIASNSLALVVDSIEYLNAALDGYRKANAKQAYLLKQLPNEAPRHIKARGSDLLFDDSD
jgi:hypothetical protein